MIPVLLARYWRLIGNPVEIRDCPAAVSENESRQSALINKRSGSDGE
jgi:hypothetical protein